MQRVSKEQVHFVRSEFYVEGVINLGVGIHFKDVAPFRFAAWPGSIGPDKLRFETAFLQRRTTLEASGDPRSVERAAIREANQVLNDLDSAGRICGDGMKLALLFPPSKLQRDLDRIPLDQSANRVFCDWYPDLGALIAMLLVLAIKSNDHDLANEYRVLATSYRRRYLKPNQEEFEALIGQLE